MIAFKIKKRFRRAERVTIPTAWSELSLEQIERIKERPSDLGALVAILTGRRDIDPASVAPFLFWVSEPMGLDEIPLPENRVDIKEHTFAQKIKLHQTVEAMGKSELSDVLGFIPEIVTIYYGKTSKYYRNQSISKTYPLARDLIDQLRAVLETEARTLPRKLTVEEIEAGAKDFAELSYFNTIDDIARDYGYTHAQVEALEYNVVFLILYRKKLLATFGERYRAILNRK